MLIGGGKTQNYFALALFLAGGVLAGVAVYYTQVGGRWLIPTAFSLLLMVAAAALVAARKEGGG
ncbi:MAG TPA: hypothetical protein VF736_19750 [Pyrinomonadaceae bacterium]|jgi:hypothetical protein